MKYSKTKGKTMTKPKPTIFISGGITGVADYKAKFANAAKELRKRGWEVVCPVEIAEGKAPDFENEELGFQVGYATLVASPQKFNEPIYEAKFMNALFDVLRLCDALFFLENWKESRGSCLEYWVYCQSKQLGFTFDESDGYPSASVMEGAK